MIKFLVALVALVLS